MAINDPINTDRNNLWESLRTGKIDANNQQLFLSILLKGLIYNLNNDISVRHTPIPHYILHTGDDINYLEIKGQNQSIEPLEVSNEDYMYNIVPRCIVEPGGINISVDELSNPYTKGVFEFECDDMIYNFVAEYRRLPLKMSVGLKYKFDNFTDALEATQQILSKLAFINRFTIVYLGQIINCSYNIPTDFQTEYQMEFDGLSSDDKTRNLSLDIEVDTNYPIIWNRTIMPSDAFIKHMGVKTYEGYHDRGIQQTEDGDVIISNINVLPIGGLKHETD